MNELTVAQARIVELDERIAKLELSRYLHWYGDKPDLENQIADLKSRVSRLETENNHLKDALEGF